MQKLVDGIHRFQKQVFGSDQEFYANLAKGQTPDALFITCADSRVNPNLLTQTRPGELFIMRNAGNIVPPYGAVWGGEAATIEYAIMALNVSDIIICGHSFCGACEALVAGKSLDELPAVGAFLKYAESTRRIMKENYPHLAVMDGKPSRELVNATVQENALVQLENLQTHPAVAARLARGELKLHAWFFKIETGEVACYDGSQSQYVKLGSISMDSPVAINAPARRSRIAAV